jgi:hypothetical protein
MQAVAMKINEELNGVELYFPGKPEKEVINSLKANKFRWSNYKKCWYSKQSEKTLQIAKSLIDNTNNIEAITPAEQTKSHNINKQNILSLWESTQWTDVEVDNKQETKAMAKEIRQHVKTRFPQCKFSVTTSGSSLHSSINFTIKSSPYEKESKYLKSILEYCSNLLNSYKYCTSYDPYGDYGNSYNFYGHASIDWQYTQTDITEDIKKDMADFDTKQVEAEKAEEERKEQEFQEWQKQRELEAIEQKKRQEEEKKQIDAIFNSINVKPLEENNQYFIIGSEFAHLNKNCTLDQYKEEVLKGEYSSEDVKITKEVHFNNEEALTNFSNMLLNDFDFLAETGGNYTDDNRVNSMTDFYNMDEEEKQSVKWNLLGVAIYFNNKLQFVVDAQGHNYARYVGLTDNARIEKTLITEPIITDEELTTLKDMALLIETISADIISELNIKETWNNDNWIEYKETFKEQLNDYNIKLTKDIIQQLEIDSLKSSMYKLLLEVDGIQEQFKQADIQQGEKITLFYISDWGSIVTSRVTFDSATPTTYAQYNNAIKLTYKPEKKRKLYYNHFYSTLLVYKGWHNLPETVLNDVEVRNDMIITKSKYHSCDKKQYDEILNHFETEGVKPIVNTYKQTF